MAVRKAKQRRNQPTKVRCPLCFRDSKVSCKTLDSGNLDVTCPERCGAFEIEDSVVRKFANLSAFDRGLLPYLRCHVRQSHERKEKARITEDNWKTLAEKRRSTPVKYKWKCLLDLLARRAERSLTGIKKFDSRIDGLLVDAPFRGDFEVLVSYLVEQGYIYRNHEDSEGEWAPDWYNLTVEGLSQIRGFDPAPVRQPTRCRNQAPKVSVNPKVGAIRLCLRQRKLLQSSGSNSGPSTTT